jgi:hypothetical protein
MMRFLRAITTRSTTSFRGEGSRRHHVVRFYGMLNIPAEYDRDTSPKNSRTFLAKFLSSLLGISAATREL